MADGGPNATTVSSADGSSIGFEVVGAGPPLLVVHGTAADRTQWYPIKDHLARRFTVHLMDRRGRGLSVDEVEPYALAKEADDLAAVVEAVGSPPFVFGHGSGGLCVLKALADGVRFRKVLIDDAPTGRPGPPQLPDELADRMRASLDAGDRDGALEIMLREVIGLNDEQVDGARGTEMWRTRAGTVHLILRETHEAAEYQRERSRLAAVDVPVRFAVGVQSTVPMQEAAQAAHADMPSSEFVEFDERLFTSMYADPEAMAGDLADWFLAE